MTLHKKYNRLKSDIKTLHILNEEARSDEQSENSWTLCASLFSSRKVAHRKCLVRPFSAFKNFVKFPFTGGALLFQKLSQFALEILQYIELDSKVEQSKIV